MTCPPAIMRRLREREPPRRISLFSALAAGFGGYSRALGRLMSPTERAIMDKVSKARDDNAKEYVAPAIVDYGTLVEITASNTHNKLSDNPLGNGILGFSAP